MKKNILLLSLFLAGNAAHAGIASKVAKTLHCTILFTPLVSNECAKMLLEKHGNTAERLEKILSAKEYKNCKYASIDFRPWGKTNVWVNPALKTWNPDLYNALKIREEAKIEHGHGLQRTALLAATPIIGHALTSPLATIQHPLIRFGRTVGIFGLMMSSLGWFNREKVKEAELRIKKPRQIGAYIDHLQEIGASQEKIDYLKEHLREMRAQQQS